MINITVMSINNWNTTIIVVVKLLTYLNYTGSFYLLSVKAQVALATRFSCKLT